MCQLSKCETWAGVRALGLTFTVLQDIGGKATFIPHISSILAILVLDDPLECVVHLCPKSHGVSKALSTYWEDHELLHGQLVPSMRTTVDHIKGLGEAADQRVTKESETFPPAPENGNLRSSDARLRSHIPILPL